MASAINALTEIQAVRLARLTAAATAVDTAFGPLSEAAEEVNVASAAIMESTSDIAEKARNEIGSVGEAEASLTKALGSFEAISKSVEAQAGYVAEASSAMTEMASSIASVTKTTDEARALTLRLQESSQAGTQSLGASVEAIRAIEAASREVNALTAAIAKISAQTNLLAMNAAIEAAHAGEKGAGFAVVAEEVRNLALSSSESNKKIKQKTAEMLNLVGNGVRLTTEVGEAFGKINSDVAATATLVSEINSAMQEQNTGTDQILRSTASLVDTSHTIQRSAEVQKEQNTRLREAVARITTSFQSIHQGAQGAAQDGERIRQAVVRLEAVAREGQGVVDEMANLVNQGA
jgi:methyl-accepting chemotaxis protein